MRIIVQGIGAVGGTIAAALAIAGQEVIGIARGKQLDAIRDRGLTLRSPDTMQVSVFPCVASPEEIDFRPDDVVILATKSQDTHAALMQLRLAGVREQHLFCAQNGVENERVALRYFPKVHGITVMLPAEFTNPGEVAAFGHPNHGIFDIGRFPSGSDNVDAELAEVLNAANFATFVVPDVMSSKFGKLIMNLRNIALAALGPDIDEDGIPEILRQEGRAVLNAAGIKWLDVGPSDPRRSDLMQIRPVEGLRRSGTSSTQSLLRATGSIETDFLNGEIVLLGRLHGVPTPANEWFTALAARMVRDGLPPGSISIDEVESALATVGQDNGR